jgi:AbrB family looped-hinge helix DNA binding protein
MLRDIKMEETTVMDEQGRVYLPKNIRGDMEIGPGVLLNVKIEKGKIVLEPRKSVAKTARGIFKLKKPIKDTDKLIKRYSYEKAAGNL